MARYIGLDVHAASCTIGVLGSSGKRLGCHVVETNARVLVDLIKTIARPRHVCFEEGTHSAWLYEVLQNKIKPNLAKVTLARQIAAITLAIWKKEEVYAPAKVNKVP